MHCALSVSLSVRSWRGTTTSCSLSAPASNLPISPWYCWRFLVSCHGALHGCRSLPLSRSGRVVAALTRRGLVLLFFQPRFVLVLSRHHSCAQASTCGQSLTGLSYDQVYQFCRQGDLYSMLIVRNEYKGGPSVPWSHSSHCCASSFASSLCSCVSFLSSSAALVCAAIATLQCLTLKCLLPADLGDIALAKPTDCLVLRAVLCAGGFLSADWPVCVRFCLEAAKGIAFVRGFPSLVLPSCPWCCALCRAETHL